MTFANALSFSRIPLLFIIIGCLMASGTGYATVALIAFILAFLSDWLDGFFARLFHQATSVGALMDALIDKVFVLGLFTYFLHVGLIPSWGLLPLILMLSRELIISGLRQCAMLKQKVIAAEYHGKLKTVLQFMSLFLFILVAFFQRDLGATPQMHAWADFFKFFGRLTFAIAALMTVVSGFYYLHRYRAYLAYNPEDSI